MEIQNDPPAFCAGSEAQEADSGNLERSCLYHSNKCRGWFQQLLNVIRNTSQSQYKFMTIEHLHKLGGVVCTCRRFGFHERLDEDLVVSSHPPVLHRLKSHLAASGCTNIVSVLEKLAATKVPGNSIEKDLGYQRLIHILDLATSKIYWPMEYSRHEARVVEDSDELREFDNPYISAFNIDNLSQYLRFLFGKQGKNIKRFSKKHHCVIKVLDSRKSYMVGVHTPVTFEVSCKDVGQGKVVEDDLRKLVKEIQSKRGAHDKKVLDYWEKRRKRAEGRRLARQRKAEASGGFAAVNNLKENAKKNYSTKYQHMLKEKSLRKLDKTQPRPTLLEEGNTWCANCFMPYDKEAEVECKYHSGYIKRCRWTCCGEDIKGFSKESQREQHKVAGCQTSRHVWKPHKKASVRRQSRDKETGADQSLG